jgi:hypothetical protein
MRSSRVSLDKRFSASPRLLPSARRRPLSPLELQLGDTYMHGFWHLMISLLIKTEIIPCKSERRRHLQIG